mmetsp:Transcript_71667/g.203350  ORF Transcript_71667/g.203350 Transcript_71667/m.203350 type:complete len:96 (+) Transcript_71667:1248-1535(+)
MLVPARRPDLEGIMPQSAGRRHQSVDVKDAAADGSSAFDPGAVWMGLALVMQAGAEAELLGLRTRPPFAEAWVMAPGQQELASARAHHPVRRPSA